MRESLLKCLQCPVCEHEYKVEVIRCKGEEIIEGRLNCSCDQKFPIIAGVPRLVGNGLREELLLRYSDFFDRNKELFDDKEQLCRTGFIGKKKQTMERFGYEWLHFSEYNCDNFKPFIAPLPADFFKGKLGLDIGCGAGRHAMQASQKGAEIVAIDLSQAVDAAQHNNTGNRLVHIVQADVYNLPFKPGIFDFVYSLGVLHHIPEPENGYQALIPFLKEGGALFVWLYAYSTRKIALEVLRAVAQRLSNNNIRRMAFLCNLIDYGLFVNLFHLTQKIPVLDKWVMKYAPLRIIEYATHGFYVSYTDWFDRLSAPITNYYKENEMKLWLMRSELYNTKILPEGNSWWWLYGERKAES